MIRKIIQLTLCILFIPACLFTQEEPKTGWTIGGVPVIGYKSDTGFQYGVVLELYNFGDGEEYPNYVHTIQGEWSRTTGGSGINEVFFDAPKLIGNTIRLTSYFGYLTELLQPFYGFNGYAAEYTPAYEINDKDQSGYIADQYRSRVFYNHDRRMWSARLDLQGPVINSKLRWIVGGSVSNLTIGKPDIEKISSNLNYEEDLPDSSLYENYVRIGTIPADEAGGGIVNILKFGLIYDTRDREANPMSGIWAELLFTTALRELGSDFSYSIVALTHRQYFTLVPNDLSFAYRLGVQGNITGRTPFFMLPFIMSSYKIEEGLGGARTLRGILKNRVVGQTIGYGNFELRWKFYRIILFNQRFYLALNTFFDTGRVLNTGEDWLHHSYGTGLRIAMNDNFIVGADYGRAIDKQDGTDGVYIIVGFLY